MSLHKKLRATFDLDDEGKPIFVQGKRLKHYKIKLSVEGVPEPIDSVTFKLHPSYRNPVREVFRGEQPDTPFQESITSFGDFEVVVSPSGEFDGGYSSMTSSEDSLRLSDALRQSAAETGGDETAIMDAIKEIRLH